MGDGGVNELEAVMAQSNSTLLRLATAGNPAHPALVRRLEAAVRDNVKVPHGIHYAFACIYRYRQRCRRNRPFLGGTPPFEWTITPALPAGLAFDKATGLISGVPQVCKRRCQFTVTATNAAGTSSTHIMLQVDPGVVLKEHDGKGGYARAHTQGGSEEAARCKVAFQYADRAKRRVLGKEGALSALATLRLRTDDFDELVHMLDIAADEFGEPVIDSEMSETLRVKRDGGVARVPVEGRQEICSHALTARAFEGCV